jgi:hypothetical protein
MEERMKKSRTMNRMIQNQSRKRSLELNPRKGLKESVNKQVPAKILVTPPDPYPVDIVGGMRRPIRSEEVIWI